MLLSKLHQVRTTIYNREVVTFGGLHNNLCKLPTIQTRYYIDRSGETIHQVA